ncbi:TrmH family RNA methyltransferase [Tomitella cavernea]|uniref:RNA methyltransferase n=1 Tax=Tomitella cavernea TaxID=1387982 RepID=A0ABP9CHB7_9ACTN|nr:RNA methyltransferase [Tomitella cavernea]
MVNVIDITDVDDPRIDDYRNLNSSDRRPDLPGGKGLVIAEGVLVVQRMLASRFAPHSLLGVDKRLQELDSDLEAADVPFYRVPTEVMDECIGFHLNRGVLAAARRAPEPDLDTVLDGARTVVALEGVNDHENIGSMFRNATGLGVDAVVFGARCADPLYRRAVRVSMGHVLRLPFTHIPEWPAGIGELRSHGFTVVALTPDPEAPLLGEVLHDRGPADRVAMLVGAEGPGLRKHTMNACDARARIPMAPGTDSLNVATAAAVAFYERLRSMQMADVR